MICGHSRRFILAGLLLASAAQAQQPDVYSEVITVSRYLVTARVLDSRGREIRDLKASDFTVTIGKERATVESASWEESGKPRAISSEPAGSARTEIDEPEARLVVFFLSRDFAANSSRLAGQMRFHLLADEMLAMLAPGDLVAVLSHNTSLQLRTDFTTDRDVIRKAIRSSILADRASFPRPLAEGPSLARHLDEEAMSRAWTPEAALLEVARAVVAQEPEPTALIMGGYGMGERGGARVTIRKEGYQAMDLLREQRVPVISFNTGIGGELSFGLMAAAKATGGMYALATSDFPSQHLNHVAGILAGRYELLLRTDQPLQSGRHSIEVKVKRSGAKVLGPAELTIDESGGQEVVSGEEVVLAPLAVPAFVEAMRLLQDGVTEGVRELLDRAIDVEGKPPEAWYERAMLAAANGDHAQAVADLRQYLLLDPGGTHADDARAFLDRLD
jgi:hypothetical protein